ncbi:MAG: phosphatase PAP2 family protein [Marinilabiliales bacterium]
MIESLENIDRNIFLYLNKLNSPFFDTIMYYTSNQYIWIPLYAVLLFLLIKKFKIQAIYITIAIIITIVLTDQLSVHLFKNVFLRYRPSHNLEIKDLVHIVNNYHGGKYGFISSHAANTFGLASIFSLIYKNRKMTLILFSWAIIVSYSRIYLGVHYPSDIVCGALFGILTGSAIYMLYIKIFNFIKIKKSTYYEKN